MGRGIISVQEGQGEIWLYLYTRGLNNALLTFLVHAEREE